MTDHQLYTESDAAAAEGYESALYRVVADGGLAVCKVCGCYEGSLATECPGNPVDMDQQDQIYAGELDFINGYWAQTTGEGEPK